MLFIVFAGKMFRIGSYSTAELNSASFLHEFTKYPSMKSFLHSKEYIPLHSTNLDALEQDVFLEIDHDIDGVVLELSKVVSCNLPLRRIHFDVRRNMVNIYHKVKKHFSLCQFSSQWHKVLKSCTGLVIGRDLGYELLVALVPNPEIHDRDIECARSRAIQIQFYKELKCKMESLMMNATSQDKLRPTLRKNQLFDMSYWDVLTADRHFVLATLDIALSNMEVPTGLKQTVLCCQFGQKESEINIKTVCDITGLIDVSIHSAATLSLPYGDMHFLWAREGLQQLLGTRGRLFPVLTLSEAANFQSNLDTNAIDISPQLRSVSKYPDCITFIQLYADTPHGRSHNIKPHPVSGSIVATNLLHVQTIRKLYQDARSYINTMKDNILKIDGLCRGRIEVVTRMKANDLPDNTRLIATDFLDDRHLSFLLENHPMLLPFKDRPDQMNINHLQWIEIIQQVAMYMCEELEILFNSNKGKGGFRASWLSLQMELGLEKMIHGQHIIAQDRILSINLGPGDTQHNERSSTYARGFLSLGNYSDCATDEHSPPPLHIWTKSSVEQARIARSFDFVDTITASHAVVGQRLLSCFVLDFKEPSMSAGTLFASLKDERLPMWSKLVGSIGVNSLSEQLTAQIKHLKYPCVTQRLAQLITEKQIDLCNVIKCGLQQSNYRRFLHLKTFDPQRHANVTWNKRDMIQVVQEGSSQSFEAKAVEMAGSVLSYLENNSFCYATTLKSLREAHDLPWMEAALRKLDGQNISSDLLTKICAYITTLAMIQNGLYIQYKKLSDLQLDIGAWRTKLRPLEIISPFAFDWMSLKINRLHPSIAWRIKPVQESTPLTGRKPAPEPIQVEETQLDEEEVHPQTFVKMPRRHVPTCQSEGRWSNAEVTLLSNIAPGRAASDQYKIYVEKCLINNIPHRNFKAFQRKISRL